MKNRLKLSCTSAKEVDILQILKSLGYTPEKQGKYISWFLSPFRDENTASFKIDTRINKWFDHGEGIGGNVIDLVTRIRNCSVSESLIHIGSVSSTFSFQKPILRSNIHIEKESNKYEILKVQALQNQALIEYLKSRCIDVEVAKKLCKEIYYKINSKNYFAIGFQNDLGGYELRNKYFKSCLIKKSFSHIKNDKKRIYIFEGFIDFLTFISHQKPALKCYDFMVLNSVSLAESTIPILREYNEVGLYLDRDEAGRKASKILTDNLNRYVDLADRSYLYKNYKDYNEMIITEYKKRNIKIA